MPHTVTLNHIEHAIILGLLFSGEARSCKPMALTDGECEVAAKLLNDFAEKLRCKLLGPATKAVTPHLFQILNHPDGVLGTKLWKLLVRKGAN
jgi:hypothetical protein